MSNITKRLNFFTGFFTTARDWQEGQEYHLERRKLHNRRLHTPGVMRGELDELTVTAAGGLNVHVRPGAAIDSQGHEIYLSHQRSLAVTPVGDAPRMIYVALRYHEEFSDHVEFVVDDTPYSGDARIAEIPRVEIVNTEPDNQTVLELARIDLQPGVTEISEPSDPQNPGPNEIDRRFVKFAGSVAPDRENLPSYDMERLINVLVDGRRDFAALDMRLPVPSCSDTRHGLISLEILARSGTLAPQHLCHVLMAIATVEQDVAQELGAAYAGIVSTVEFRTYRQAVSTLMERIGQGALTVSLLNAQAAVSEAARELSEVALKAPVANAGADISVNAGGDGTATVRLDASGSKAFEGRQIVRYHWKSCPAADAGEDRVVYTTDDSATVNLDARGSTGDIVRYHWDKNE